MPYRHGDVAFGEGARQARNAAARGASHPDWQNGGAILRLFAQAIGLTGDRLNAEGPI